MYSGKNKRSRKAPSYANVCLSWGTPFDINNYLNNSSMIMQLYKEMEIALTCLDKVENLLEDKMSSEADLVLECKEINIRLEEKCNINKKLEQETDRLSFSLREGNKRIEKMLQEAYQLQMKLALTEGKLEDSSRSSFLQFTVSMIATIVLGFGVNIVTVAPDNWIAWVLIITSMILSIISFMYIKKSK